MTPDLPPFYLDKPLPHNPTAERTMLGFCMLNNNLFEVIEKLDPEVFYSPVTRMVFKAMQKARTKGLELSPIIIADNWPNNEAIESIGGISTIVNMTIGLTNVSDKTFKVDYVDLLVRQWVRRKLINECSEITRQAMDDDADIKTTLQSADGRMTDLQGMLNRGRERPQGFLSYAEMRDEFGKRVDDYYYGRIEFTRTGIDALDDQLEGGGLVPNGMYFTVARPKAGKTALSLKIADYVATVQRRTPLIVSAEMHRLQVFLRNFSRYTGIPYYKFRPTKIRDGKVVGGMTEREYKQAKQMLKSFANIPVKVADNLFDFPKIREKVLREQDLAPLDKPLGLVMVDYMQLIALNAISDKMQRADEVAKVSRSFKMLSMETSVPTWCISTMNNSAAKEVGKFTMFDLKESGNLAYDAEAIFGLNNPNYKGPDYVRQPVEDIDLSILANRGGSTNDVHFKFIGNTMTFLSEEEYERAARNDRGPQYHEIKVDLMTDKQSEDLWNQLD